MPVNRPDVLRVALPIVGWIIGVVMTSVGWGVKTSVDIAVVRTQNVEIYRRLDTIEASIEGMRGSVEQVVSASGNRDAILNRLQQTTAVHEREIAALREVVSLETMGR